MISVLLPLMLVVETPTPRDSNDFPEWFMGYWSGEGTFFEKPAKMGLSICPLAEENGIELEYKVVAEGDGGETIRFTGRADYFPDGNTRWRGNWFGSNGVNHELKAVVSDKAFIATWHNEAVETGQTHYEFSSEGKIKVTDYVLRNGKSFEAFASANYNKTSPCNDLPEDRAQ